MGCSDRSNVGGLWWGGWWGASVYLGVAQREREEEQAADGDGEGEAEEEVELPRVEGVDGAAAGRRHVQGAHQLLYHHLVDPCVARHCADTGGRGERRGGWS